jgi:hypothetical protein
MMQRRAMLNVEFVANVLNVRPGLKALSEQGNAAIDKKCES